MGSFGRWKFFFDIFKEIEIFLAVKIQFIRGLSPVLEIQSEASMSTSFTELTYRKQKAGLKKIAARRARAERRSRQFPWQI